MNVATLRVEGEEVNLTTLVDRLGLDINVVWKKGKPKPRGGEYQSSGFNANIANPDNTKEMLQYVRDFLAKCEASGLSSFIIENVSAELAIGVTVGDSKQLVAFVELSSAELASLGALGIALSFSAYPTSDEANAQSS